MQGFQKSEATVKLDWKWKSYLDVWFAGPFAPGTEVTLGGCEYNGSGNDDNYSIALHPAAAAAAATGAHAAANGAAVKFAQEKTGDEFLCGLAETICDGAGTNPEMPSSCAILALKKTCGSFS